MRLSMSEATTMGSESRLRAGRISAGFFLVCVVAGLAASIQALRVTFVRGKHLAALAVAPGWLRAALALGIAALVAAAWRRLRTAGGEDPWAPLRLLFEVLVLGSISYLAVLPFSKDTFDVCLGLAAGLWGAVCTAAGRRPFRRSLRALEVAVFNLCLFGVLAESGLRLVAAWSSSPLLEQTFDRPSTVIRKKREERSPGRLRFGFPLNSGSYYDTEFLPVPSGRTVAMIGDSFSYGVVPHRLHFSTICERKLRAEVYNFGFPGIGPAEYLYLLETEVAPLSPAVIAVNIFVGNDIGDAKVKGFRYPRLRAWFDLDNLLVYQVPLRLWRIREEQRARGGDTPVGGVAGEDAERRLETVEEMIAAYPWLADPALEQRTLAPQTYFRIEKHRAESVCDPSHTDFSALFSFVRDMRLQAGETPFVVQIIPDEFQVDDRLWRRITHASRRDLVRDQPQEILVDWLDREGIPHLDLLAELRQRCAASSLGKRHCYHLSDTHFNRRGNWVAGQAMAEFLVRYLPQSERSRAPTAGGAPGAERLPTGRYLVAARR